MIAKFEKWPFIINNWHSVCVIKLLLTLGWRLSESDNNYSNACNSCKTLIGVHIYNIDLDFLLTMGIFYNMT